MANFFAQQPAVQAQAPVATQPGASALNNAATNIAASDATRAAATVTDTKAAAPLAQFEKLWENAGNDSTSTASKGVLPAVTAEQLTGALANSNFLSNVDPQLLAKAAAGDATAFSDVINSGLRTVMTQAVLTSHSLIEAGAKSHGEQLRTSLPSMVRSSNVSDSLQDNPLYSNPAAKPMVDMVKAQLEAKHPQASAREIAELTHNFIKDFAGLATPKQETQAQKGRTPEGDTDWYQLLGL